MLTRRPMIAFLALCAFLGLGASPLQSTNPGPWTDAAWEARIGKGPDGTPTPANKRFAIPRPRPERRETRPAGTERAEVLQCRGATIFARPIPDSSTRIFTASYSSTTFDALLSGGCFRIEQGCNTCIVRYSDCESRDAVAACRDGDCMQKVCEKRQVICTAKSCTVEGTQIDCRARLARHRCLLDIGDVRPVDRGSLVSD